MNPSAIGWVTKLGELLLQEPWRYNSFEELYTELKQTGFVYGVHVSPLPFIRSSHPLTEDEIAKVNHLTALYYAFVLEKQRNTFEEFLETLFDFYTEMGISTIKNTRKILEGKRTPLQLEKLIDSRIYLGGKVFNKAMGNNLTNALLFIDVLIYMDFLREEFSLKGHAQLLEYVSINLAYHTLYSKDLEAHDLKLIKLLSSSLSYITLDPEEFDGSYRELLRENFRTHERDFLFDLACLTVWEDKTLEVSESEFIYEIGLDLGKSKSEIAERLLDVQFFYAENYKNVPYLKSRNLASSFFDGVTKNVRRLLRRNSARLKKELLESKELLYLLRQSTRRELLPEEKKKVQQQLLDIFKTIPSLAIFMLPGGSILLPIAIGLIPKLLPSAFDENRLLDTSLEKQQNTVKKENR